MNLRSRSRDEPEVNLTSLIDVVLLLLVFFMVTTSFVREAQIAIRLPEAEAPEVTVVEEPTLEITVMANGEYRVNGRPLVDARATTLMSALRQVGEGGGRPVTISADADAPHQAVVTAMDAAGRLGFVEIRIATRKPRGDE